MLLVEPSNDAAWRGQVFTLFDDLSLIVNFEDDRRVTLRLCHIVLLMEIMGQLNDN